MMAFPQAVDLFPELADGLRNFLEFPVDLLELPAHLDEPLVDLFELFVDSSEPLVDLPE